jgi:methionyl-tRNA formyltransferase
MKVAFLGTPSFAVPSLQKLLTSRHNVVCVVTQPDEKSGRGQAVAVCPVKQFAVEHGIPILQPERISKEAEKLGAYKPDIIVTCAFGQILRQSVLDIAPVINVHGSLLPKYRGAAPIQRAIINGDSTTGVTIAKTELGLDCGAIIEQCETKIGAAETAGELFGRLSVLGAELLITALDKIESKTAKYTPQNEAEVTVAPMLSKETARIDLSKSAAEIANLVRGLNTWPVAVTQIGGVDTKIYRAAAVAEPAGEGLFVKCGTGYLRIEELQFPNKKRIFARDYLNGQKTKRIVITGA